MFNLGQKLGITTWSDSQRYGLSLTLGGGEVRMVDMAAVFGTFANLGHRVNLNPILKISHPNDQKLNYNLQITNYKQYLNSNSQNSNKFNNETMKQWNDSPILDPRVAFLINHILSDHQARIPGFGRYSLLNIANHTVAVKTGTSNNLRDNWAIGYTPDYLVAVWVGNFDNSPMARIASGITGATPIWNKLMTYLLDEYQLSNHETITPLNHESEYQLPITNYSSGNTSNTPTDPNDFPWAPPLGLISVPICPYTNTLPCDGCSFKAEWIIQST